MPAPCASSRRPWDRGHDRLLRIPRLQRRACWRPGRSARHRPAGGPGRQTERVRAPPRPPRACRADLEVLDAQVRKVGRPDPVAEVGAWRVGECASRGVSPPSAYGPGRGTASGGVAQLGTSGPIWSTAPKIAAEGIPGGWWWIDQHGLENAGNPSGSRPVDGIGRRGRACWRLWWPRSCSSGSPCWPASTLPGPLAPRRSWSRSRRAIASSGMRPDGHYTAQVRAPLSKLRAARPNAPLDLPITVRSWSTYKLSPSPECTHEFFSAGQRGRGARIGRLMIDGSGAVRRLEMAVFGDPNRGPLLLRSKYTGPVCPPSLGVLRSAWLEGYYVPISGPADYPYGYRSLRSRTAVPHNRAMRGAYRWHRWASAAPSKGDLGGSVFRYKDADYDFRTTISVQRDELRADPGGPYGNVPRVGEVRDARTTPLRQLRDPDGPFNGMWYVGGSGLEIRRKLLINRYYLAFQPMEGSRPQTRGRPGGTLTRPSASILVPTSSSYASTRVTGRRTTRFPATAGASANAWPVATAQTILASCSSARSEAMVPVFATGSIASAFASKTCSSGPRRIRFPTTARCPPRTSIRPHEPGLPRTPKSALAATSSPRQSAPNQATGGTRPSSSLQPGERALRGEDGSRMDRDPHP